MNASALIVFCLIALLAVVSAAPVSLREEQSPEVLPPEEPAEEENLGLRFRRVTCDVFSLSLGSVSLNHSACAIHCLAMRKGFRGGRCEKGVCRCRK